ncbi:Ubiquitin-conjugating enzyme [Handroanthus impetiginosus]|uniref:Ubiquitin-conjugating enzyme n=1 Tax=Handroanthus impetiginosus TaxID=429701 RepID=A0A2G9HFF6_9LAMI|nr:Ubiquitin-conjugating enzyme [Handroanthus impetiginosus]
MAASIELQDKNIANANTSKYQIQENWQVSTWNHRAWFTSGCATVLISLVKALFLITNNSKLWLDSVFAALIGYITADLCSGIYHWAVDNYGNGKTPIFGSQIEAFQAHHRKPSAISTTRKLAYSLYIEAVIVTIVVTPINLLSHDAVLLVFFGVFACCVMFGQVFHAWAHTPRKKLPSVVAALQDAGIIIGRVQHAAHHQPPYNSNYCIVSGVWNRFLDKAKFFMALEVLFASVLGVRPRSWNVPISDGALVPGMNL